MKAKQQQLIQLLRFFGAQFKQAFLLAKEMFRASNINRDLDWTLRELGSLTYYRQTQPQEQQPAAEQSQLMEQLCERIQSLQFKMEQVEQRIQQLKQNTPSTH